MRALGVVAAGLVALFPGSVGLSQSPSAPSASVSASASLVLPADEHTRTSAGGSFEFDLLLSKALSLGATAGFWSGESDFVKDSRVGYFGGVATYRWRQRKLRPFLQLGGGIYNLKFQFPSRNRFAPDEKEARGGAFAGSGLDYALSRSSAIEVRARYHLVRDASGVHPDFLESQLGIRFFF
jgi:hypothetical protein